MISPGSRVRIAAPIDFLPQTLIAFRGRIGVLIQWEGEVAVVQFGQRVAIVAAGHLACCEDVCKPQDGSISA